MSHPKNFEALLKKSISLFGLFGRGDTAPMPEASRVEASYFDLMYTVVSEFGTMFLSHVASVHLGAVPTAALR
jgi:hypothetical protein